MKRLTIQLAGIAAVAALLITTVKPAVPFTQGKILRIIVGTTPGGGFDTHARLVARHIARYLPGNPKIIVQNMPGGSGVIAANFLYNVVKPDGLTILASLPVHVQQLVGRKGVQYDYKTVRWIGSTNGEVMVAIVRSINQYRSLNAIKKAPKPPNFGFGSKAGLSHQFGALINRALELNINLIAGYRGTSRIKLAVERGELDGFAGITMSAAFSSVEDWLRKDFVKILVQSGMWDPKTSSYKRHPRIKDVPTVLELAAPKHRTLINLINAGQVGGRPYVAPPKVPADRVKVLRDAFWATVTSPEYKKESKRVFRTDLEPVRGKVLQDLMAKVMAASPQDRALLKELLLE